MTNKNQTLAIFSGKQIRRHWNNNKRLWYFSVSDVIAVLTESKNPVTYWRKLKERLLKEGGNETVTNCHGLKMLAPDGKMRLTDTADTQTMLRLIQSIPSPKAEPFKRWLAKVGYERVQEIEDPELASKRTRALYKLKGYSDDWIEKRMRGIAIREELTDEWHRRGAKENTDFQILTAEISKATFGVTPKEYKKLKGLKRENLRDHMDDFELIFNMLGERATTEIHRTENSQGVPKLRSDAKAGGDISGGARKKLEKRLGRSIVAKNNFLSKSTERKTIKSKDEN